MSRSRTLIEAFEGIFRDQKGRARKALDQLSTEELHQPVAPGMNTVAVIVKHMAGNMRSRWTDFLSADGEKPWRQRDDEFCDDGVDREEVLRRFENGWACVFDALKDLSDEDLERTVTIRAEPHTVAQAMLRQVDHYGYHVGQIVSFARMIRGDAWTHLSIPPGGTAAFNASMGYDPKNPS